VDQVQVAHVIEERNAPERDERRRHRAHPAYSSIGEGQRNQRRPHRHESKVERRRVLFRRSEMRPPSLATPSGVRTEWDFRERSRRGESRTGASPRLRSRRALSGGSPRRRPPPGATPPQRSHVAWRSFYGGTISDAARPAKPRSASCGGVSTFLQAIPPVRAVEYRRE
jgi:hypothetical protein